MLIDYQTQAWQDEFEEGYLDIVFDTVGEAGTALDALTLLSKNGGRFVTIAGSLALPSSVPPGTTQSAFINSDTTLVSSPLLNSLNEMVRAGLLRMPSISVFGLDQVDEAFSISAAGHVVGKLVVSISNNTNSSKTITLTP